MNQISTNLKTHKIILTDNEQILINKLQRDEIARQIKDSSYISINGRIIKKIKIDSIEPLSKEDLFKLQDNQRITVEDSLHSRLNINGDVRRIWKRERARVTLRPKSEGQNIEEVLSTKYFYIDNNDKEVFIDI